LHRRSIAGRLPSRAQRSERARPFRGRSSTLNIRAEDIAVDAGDGHRWQLLARVPATPRRSLLWLPALGIAARHYASLADALAARGIATFVHEWRGNGSSSLRASRQQDWGYRELL